MRNILSLAKEAIELNKQALAEFNDVLEENDVGRVKFPVIYLLHIVYPYQRVLWSYKEFDVYLKILTPLLKETVCTDTDFDDKPFSNEEIDFMDNNNRFPPISTYKNWSLKNLKTLVQDITDSHGITYAPFKFDLNKFLSRE